MPSTQFALNLLVSYIFMMLSLTLSSHLQQHICYVHVQLLCRVLGPYLKGGGAKSLDFQSLSQDLIRTSMQIPFSVPPYMSLLARSTATLEGIALLGDPNYQMVSQVTDKTHILMLRSRVEVRFEPKSVCLREELQAWLLRNAFAAHIAIGLVPAQGNCLYAQLRWLTCIIPCQLRYALSNPATSIFI